MCRCIVAILVASFLLTLRCSGEKPPETVPDKSRDRSIQADPDYYASIELQRGDGHLTRREYAQAVQSYKSAIGYNPQLASAHCNLGYVYYIQGNHEEAEENFKKTIQIEPRYAGAHFYLGRIGDEKGLLDEAIHHYEEAVRILPRYAVAHFFLARDYEKKGLIRDALRAYKSYLKYAPDGDGRDECKEAIKRLGRR